MDGQETARVAGACAKSFAGPALLGLRAYSCSTEAVSSMFMSFIAYSRTRLRQLTEHLTAHRSRDSRCKFAVWTVLAFNRNTYTSATGLKVTLGL